MRKTILGVLGGLALGVASAGAAEVDRAGVVAALQAYLASAEPAPSHEPSAKAVPRTDKAEATIIGSIDFISESDLLDDGTPWRLVVVQSRKPFAQYHYVACVGAAANTACGRLRGGRVQFTADLVSVQDGEDAGFVLLISKKIKT